MAILRIFGVQDAKIGAFIFTFNAVNEGAAIRTLGDLASQEGHPFNRHPEDYGLYELGTFDDSDGRIEATPLRSVCNLASL